jgi:signal transduction histidine kinase/ActR/RegA family two-component response regulator
MLVSISQMIYLIVVTGGTASVIMIWITGISLMPFMLLSRKAAITWLILQTNALFLILLASQAGWIVTRPISADDMVFWAFTNKMLAALTLIVILDFLDRSQQKQLHNLQIRGHDLRNLHQELIRAQSHKDEFIASVGHELRTPMNAILGLNTVLRDQLVASEQDLNRVDMIRESTQHLLALVNDILDFSQLQAQRMTLGPQAYDLRHGFDDIARKLQLSVSVKGLQCQTDFDERLPHWVLLDGKRFEQLIANLLENALKFTHQGFVNLRFQSCHFGLRIEVQDSGIGMTPEQQSHVFGRFEKAASGPVNLYGGTGLGLSICEKLVQLQNGTIGVQSNLHSGSLFWVELPLVIANAPNDTFNASTQGIASESQPQQFLVVDDQAVNLLVAQRLLQKIWPHAKVQTASSGQEALNWLALNPVDMVLMDMFMPDMDGLQATTSLRALPSHVRHVKVIGLTASSNANDHKQCLEVGMNDITMKPLEEQSLKECILRCWRDSL